MHDVGDERPDQPPIAGELAQGFRVGCRGAAFGGQQRAVGAAGAHGEVSGDLPPAGLAEIPELRQRHVPPFDVGLPELADGAKGQLIVLPGP
jgi:hypothetical protein